MSSVYVASAQQKDIAAYSVNGGQVSSVGKPVMTPGAAPSAVAATANGDLLYAATESGAIYLYRIVGDGSLRLANGGAAVAHVDHPVRMTLDRSGNWLFVASSSTSRLYQFRVDAVNGTLQAASASTITLSAAAAAQIYLSPDDRNLFAALGSGGVDAFSFDPNSGSVGPMSHVAPLSPGKPKDSAVTSDPASKFLFVGEAGSGVRVLRIVSDGVLQEISGSPFASPQLTTASLVVTPANGQLMVADSNSSTIQGFSIGTGGALTPASRTASNVASSPAALSLGTSGNYVVALSGGSTPSLRLIGF